MGKIISLENKILIPTDVNIDIQEESIQKAFWACYNNEPEKIPMFPVRQHPENEKYLFVLDGNKRASILNLFQITDFQVYQAEDDLDWMDRIYPDKIVDKENKEEESILKEMNDNIFWRYNYILEDSSKRKCPKNFAEMLEPHTDLMNIKSAKKYFRALKVAA